MKVTYSSDKVNPFDRICFIDMPVSHGGIFDFFHGKQTFMKNLRFFVPLLLAGLMACRPEAPIAQQKAEADILTYVDPLIGTGFHGHTFPGAVVPHGRIQLSPDTHLMGWDASSGYHYEDSTLFGFSHTHLSGTGIGDLGDILFLPFTGNVPEEKPVGFFSHKSETASPGYYKVVVQPWNVMAELTATKRTGWHRYTYPEGKEAGLMIDLGHVLQPDWGHKIIGGEIKIIDQQTIEGYRLTSGWAAEDPVWFRCAFSRPIKNHQIFIDGTSVEDKEGKGKNIVLYLTFGNDNDPLEARLGISSVDADGARVNWQKEASTGSFDETVTTAKDVWRKELSSIKIKTNDSSVLKNFYTALYHSKIAPMIFNDNDGRYIGIDREIHPPKGREHYTVYSLWDVFRSWYPLMTIIEPQRAGEWAMDLYQHYLEGGLLPKWPLNGNYTGTMVGYPAVAVLADAAQKRLINDKAGDLLKAAVASATWQQEFYDRHKGSRAAGVMPIQIYYKEKLGFVPIDKCSESVSYGLEMAYYDWCVSKLAQSAGDEDTAAMFMEKGKVWQRYFDKRVKFMRGVRSNGSWDRNFNARYSNHQKSEFVEGNAYQWTPFVPHDPEGLAEIMGGQEAFGVWLDTLYSTSSKIEGEHASGDITGLIGQYAHGNEPSHHIPYLYHFTDRPWRANEVLDTILYHFYKPEPAGIIGNEDCGQMSAWYVLNALGIYQLAPGNPEFIIGRPLVDEASIKVPGGMFEIIVHNNSKTNKYIKEVRLNGNPFAEPRISYASISAGSKLEIFMTDRH